MKVLALVILTVAAAAGKGSGPYLPSGWKPEGPSFYLPSEVKPTENLKDIILAGSEASGSDSLREYGPPKVVDLSQNLLNQGLPDAVIEQSFDTAPLIVEIVKEAAKEAIESTEEKTEQALEQSEAATESVIKVDAAFEQPIVVVESDVESTQTSLANEETSDANIDVSQFEKVVSERFGKSSKSESSSTQESSSSFQSSSSQESSSSSSSSQSSSSQESSSLSQSSSSQESSSNVESISGQVSQESLSNEQTTDESQSDVTEKSEAQVNSGATLEQAQNIPDIIASLENENKAQQVEEAVNEQDASTAAPEGFLEYGPPGFAEYGPPKGELAQDANEEVGDQSFENTNETRRRRFSPKFRSLKKN